MLKNNFSVLYTFLFKNDGTKVVLFCDITKFLTVVILSIFLETIHNSILKLTLI